MFNYFNKHMLASCLIATSLISGHVLASETGTAIKADTLKAEPFADAKPSGTLTKNQALNILNKKGAWLQVKTNTNTGWVRLLSVKRDVNASGSLKGAVEVASGRAGTGKVVSTTGIRGLSAEELKAAKFNETEMKKMESITQTPANAEQFAIAGGLAKSNVAYFKGGK